MVNKMGPQMRRGKNAKMGIVGVDKLLYVSIPEYDLGNARDTARFSNSESGGKQFQEISTITK